MNTKAKGKLLEKRAKQILESEGWLVEQANPKLQFIGKGKVISKAHDFFGCWDFCCVKTQEILWVQVSVWEKFRAKVKQVQDFPILGLQEIWLWYAQGKNGHFRIVEKFVKDPFYSWHGQCKKPIRECKFN